MENFETKKKVLQEIMDLMDEKEGENLKMKSPKFMAAKVEVEKPSTPEDMPESETSISEESEELDPQTIQKILEMYKDLK